MRTALQLLCLASVLSITNQVSLRLDPDQSQFFKQDLVSLSCEDSSGDWTVRRNTSEETRTQCETWGMIKDSVCINYRLHSWYDTGRYWCESREGQTSDSVHITVTDRGVVLQVPVLPVTEGQIVSLSCRHHTSSNLSARFHRDGHFLWEEPTGHMTLQQVSASDEGRYQCEIRGETSESSWLWVRRVTLSTIETLPPTSETPPPTTETPPLTSERPLALALLCHLVVLCPYVVSTVLMVSLYRQTLSEQKRSMAPPTQAPPFYPEPGLDEDYYDVIAVTTEHQF